MNFTTIKVPAAEALYARFGGFNHQVIDYRAPHARRGTPKKLRGPIDANREPGRTIRVAWPQETAAGAPRARHRARMLFKQRCRRTGFVPLLAPASFSASWPRSTSNQEDRCPCH